MNACCITRLCAAVLLNTPSRENLRVFTQYDYVHTEAAQDWGKAWG